jgi:hypothetical protein
MTDETTVTKKLAESAASANAALSGFTSMIAEGENGRPWPASDVVARYREIIEGMWEDLCNAAPGTATTPPLRDTDLS